MRYCLPISRCLFILIVLALSSACSNGRGSVGGAASDPPTGGSPGTPAPVNPTPPTPEPQPPEPRPEGSAFAGYWAGAVVRKGDDRWRREASALVDREGDAHIIVHDGADSFVVYGRLCCKTDLDAKLKGARYLQTRSEKSNLSASVASGGLTGEFEFRQRDYRYALSTQSAWREPLSLRTLGGVYTRTLAGDAGPAGTLTLAIDSDGEVVGSHTNGCVFNGVATISDPSRNMASFEIKISGCRGDDARRWNGDYGGLAVLLRGAPAPGAPGAREDTLLLSLVGPTWLGLLSLGR